MTPTVGKTGPRLGLGLGLSLSLLCFWLLAGAVQGSFEVNVWPEAPMVEHGGSVWINCSTTCRDVTCRGGLETSLTKARSESGPGWAAFYLVNVSEWVSAPLCYFTNGIDTESVAAKISVYRVPEQVVLEPLPELELGRAHNLTCRVLSVAPVRHLNVTLRRGGQTLHTETFQNHAKIEADSITVTHEIIPRQRDHGQEATCHAALDLRPLGPLFERSSPTQELSVYGEFPHHTLRAPETRLRALAALGRHDCCTLHQSRSSLAVGYSFVARPTQHGQEIVCRARLRVGQQVLRDSARATLQVWAPPHSVNVSVAQPEFPPGAIITVRCSAQGSPPPELRWELPSNASVELSDRGRTVTVSSAQRAHSGTYRCLAQNRYGASAGQVDVLVKDTPKRGGLIAALVVVGVIVTLGAAGAWLLVRKRFGTS